jgi:hypothetical protein
MAYPQLTDFQRTALVRLLQRQRERRIPPYAMELVPGHEGYWTDDDKIAATQHVLRALAAFLICDPPKRRGPSAWQVLVYLNGPGKQIALELEKEQREEQEVQCGPMLLQWLAGQGAGSGRASDFCSASGFEVDVALRAANYLVSIGYLVPVDRYGTFALTDQARHVLRRAAGYPEPPAAQSYNIYGAQFGDVYGGQFGNYNNQNNNF